MEKDFNKQLYEFLGACPLKYGDPKRCTKCGRRGKRKHFQGFLECGVYAETALLCKICYWIIASSQYLYWQKTMSFVAWYLCKIEQPLKTLVDLDLALKSSNSKMQSLQVILKKGGEI